MKKLGLLLIVLLIGAVAFAQEFTPSVKLTGSASVTFGIDLDGTAIDHGFANTSSSALTITFVPKASKTVEGEGWYGSITVKDFTATAFAITNGTVTAKITDGSTYVTIYSGPTDVVDFADPIEAATDPDASADADVAADGALTPSGGVTIGTAMDGPLSSIAVAVFSGSDWSNDDAADDYGAKLTGTVKVSPLQFDFGVLYSGFDAGTLGFGVQPKITLADVMNGVTFDVGFDGQMPNGGDLAYEADVNVTVNISEANADDVKANVAVGAYYATDDLDAKVAFTEPTAGGLADGIGATATIRILDLMAPAGAVDPMDWLLDVTGAYDMGGIAVNVAFGTGSDEVNSASASVALKSAFTSIENTTFTLSWASTDLSTVKGIVKLETKVSF